MSKFPLCRALLRIFVKIIGRWTLEDGFMNTRSHVANDSKLRRNENNLRVPVGFIWQLHLQQWDFRDDFVYKWKFETHVFVDFLAPSADVVGSAANRWGWLLLKRPLLLLLLMKFTQNGNAFLHYRARGRGRQSNPGACNFWILKTSLSHSEKKTLGVII